MLQLLIEEIGADYGNGVTFYQENGNLIGRLMSRKIDMETMIILFSFGMPEILLIALVVLLLFGGAKIPELMRGIGKGVSEFKKGVRDVENEIKNTDTKEEDKKA